MPNPRPILDLIAAHESESAAARQGVASGYDVVWGGIASADRPGKRLSTMTVAEVLAWQDRIDSRYRSEAAGRYQIMEDTLRGLVANGAVMLSDRFDATTQDAACVALMAGRGWRECAAGQMTPERFADRLAREWASFPVITDQRGASRDLKRGQSYYAGDGLNKAGVSPEVVLAAIREALAAPDHMPPPPERRASPVQSRTVQASGVQIATGAGAAITGVAALDGTAQIVAIVGGLIVAALALYIMRERVKAWSEGWR